MRLATDRADGDEPRAGLVIERAGVDHVIDIAAASGGALPADLLAAAGNYQAHILEGGRPVVDKTRTVPKLFLKPSTSIIGQDAPLHLPAVSSSVDWELGLAIVIETGGRTIPLDTALDTALDYDYGYGYGYGYGYAIINDISAHTLDWDIAERADGAWEGSFDWLKGRWVDDFAPIGPWIVTADEIPDSDALDLRLHVNGNVRQEASTADMIFDTRELIAFASRLLTLEPGDTIATATPAGVRDTHGNYLHAGDRMEGWIEGLDTLVTPVVAGEQ